MHSIDLFHFSQVRGEVHHDRRLHQLMLQEELRLYAAAGVSAPAHGTPGGACGLSDSAGSVHSDLAAAVASEYESSSHTFRCGA